MLKKSIILYIIILFCHLLAAQKVTISGYIEDESSGEKLIGCNIFHPSTPVSYTHLDVYKRQEQNHRPSKR